MGEVGRAQERAPEMTLTNVSKLEKYADRLPDFTSSAMDWDWGAIVTVEGGNAAEVGRILSKSCRGA